MILHLQSLTDEQIASFDCTVVVCMFNAGRNQRQLDYSEVSGLGALVIALCALLGKHKRAAITMGGSAALWQFSEDWDSMVQKNVALSRVSGIMPCWHQILSRIVPKPRRLALRQNRT